MLERLDPNPEYWEGKRGACVGVFQAVMGEVKIMRSGWRFTFPYCYCIKRVGGCNRQPHERKYDNFSGDKQDKRSFNYSGHFLF
jgi:hypothetical protein